MAHTDLSKEMVDLVMKIKKHLRAEHDISVALADPDLLNKLVELKNVDDPVLQGMLSYLMALAGKEWNKRYQAQDTPPAEQPAPPAGKRKLFARYRSSNASSGEESENKSPAPREKAPAPTEDGQNEERKPIRYYRGQPVYE